MTEVESGIMLAKNDLTTGSKGSYVLLIKLPEEQTIAIGSLQAIRFHRGYYAYVGSAMSGIKSRLDRHLRNDKKLHWHIDYLLQKASIDDIIICETKDRIECPIAQALGRQFDSIPGFGASDCRCRSHLFFAAFEMKSAIISILNQPDIRLSGSLSLFSFGLASNVILRNPSDEG